jgi:hypothetical protein
LLAAMSLTLGACGTVAGANTPPPPPTLPPAPPLSEEAQQAINQPTPTPPPPAPAQSSGPGTQSVVLLSDDFSGPLSGWTAEDFSEGPESPATWVAQNGEVFQQGNSSGLPAPDSTFLVAGEPSWDNYTLSAYGYAEQPTRLGLVARKSGSSYYWMWVEAHDAGGELVVAVVQNAETTILSRTPVPGNTVGAWLKLSLDLRGSTITATLDDTSSVSVTDTTLSSGQAGLYATADGSARFDNVLVAE